MRIVSAEELAQACVDAMHAWEAYAEATAPDSDCSREDAEALRMKAEACNAKRKYLTERYAALVGRPLPE